VIAQLLFLIGYTVIVILQMNSRPMSTSYVVICTNHKTVNYVQKVVLFVHRVTWYSNCRCLHC